MKSQAEYLKDAVELLSVAQDVRESGSFCVRLPVAPPPTSEEKLRMMAAVLWQAAREARRDEHLHYCAICRHGKPCSRITKIRQGLT